MDLDEFTEKHRRMDGRRRRCLTCSLSEDQLFQVQAARLQQPPVSFEIISKWLKEDQGVTLHPNTIRNHFINRHHE